MVRINFFFFYFSLLGNLRIRGFTCEILWKCSHLALQNESNLMSIQFSPSFLSLAVVPDLIEVIPPVFHISRWVLYILKVYF